MQVISAEEVKKRMDNKEPLHLVDVREPYEHEEFNIGGVLVPLKKIQSLEIDELESLKDQEVICYCRSGNRSGQACLLLETAGFSNVKNLAGGMLGWQENFGK